MVPWGRPNLASLTFIRPAASSWHGDLVLRQAGIPVTTDTRKANGQFLATTTFGVRFYPAKLDVHLIPDDYPAVA